MKVQVGAFVKSQSPATATATVNVVGLEENEKFDVETLEKVTRYLLKLNEPLFAIMDFHGHQTFKVIFNYEFDGNVIPMAVFPVYTKNYRRFA